MSEFKAGDEVLVRGKVQRDAEDGYKGVRVAIRGFVGAGYVPESDVLPVPVEPQPVDPSTLRVGDRVRQVVEADPDDQDFVQTYDFTVVRDGVLTLSTRNANNFIKSEGRWFLLDRPVPVDPRREAVTRAVAQLRARDVMLTDSDVVDRLLAAIDGAVQR